MNFKLIIALLALMVPNGLCKGQCAPSLLPKAKNLKLAKGEVKFARLKPNFKNLAGKAYLNDLREEFVVFEEKLGLIAHDSGTEIPVEFILLEEAKGRRNRDAYQLRVGEGKITLSASYFGGFFYGLQSLSQLVEKRAGSFALAKMSLQDKPAFGMRGMMLDLGRYYLSPAMLRQIARRMADYKLNVLQLHLTEDIAWRIESKKYPQLTDGQYHWQSRLPGKFYSQKELKDFVEFCRKLNIEVIPEIDMPGHSKAFARALKFPMQSPQGIKALKEILNEILPLFPSQYCHLGSDETRFSMPQFMPDMLAFIKAKGKIPIVWSPGYLPKEDAVLMNWGENEAGHQLIKDRPYIDSNGFYMDWMDSQSGVYQVFFQQPCEVAEGNEKALGAMMPVWCDGNLSSEKRLYEQYPFFPTMLTFAERVWCGRKEKNKALMAQLPAKGTASWREFAEFEKRLVAHRDRYFKDLPFAYVEQSHVEWKVVGPFDHKGQNDRSFEPEEIIKESYSDNAKELVWQSGIVGSAIHIRHLYAMFNMHRGHYRTQHWPTAMSAKVGQENGTCYALTYLFSPKDQDVHLMFGLNGMWGHSGGYRSARAPEQGQWDFNGGALWLNDREISAPKWPFESLPWTGWGRGRIEDAPLTEEGYFFRPPIAIHLQKGWNKVLIRAVFGHWKGDTGQRKWFFNYIPVKWDGKHYREVEGLIFSTEKAL